MNKNLIILILFLILNVKNIKAEKWYDFISKKNLKINNKIYKIKGTPYNPVITKKETLLFGTGAGFIYEFNKNGLVHFHEENGIFYHVFDFNNKIIALSGTPLNGGGNSYIIIFSDNYQKRKILFHDTYNGRTSICYLKNKKDNLLLVNMGGGYWFGNNYFIIDCGIEKIIWKKRDDSSVLVPYKSIDNGFEFIKAETDYYNIFDKQKNELIERYNKIKDIVILQMIFKENNRLTENQLETNLTEFIDLTKKYSCVSAWVEEKIFSNYNKKNSGIHRYLYNLKVNNTIKLYGFPELKEYKRLDNEKVIFKKIN
jgi:hypothetical protein